MPDWVIGVLTLLLGPGGIAIALINTRAGGKTKITPKQAEEQAAVDVIESSGLSDRYLRYADDIDARRKKYTDEIESRLNRRIDDLEGDLKASRRGHRIAVEYAGDLRLHINKELPPPPPPWPDGINP